MTRLWTTTSAGRESRLPRKDAANDGGLPPGKAALFPPFVRRCLILPRRRDRGPGGPQALIQVSRLAFKFCGSLPISRGGGGFGGGGVREQPAGTAPGL